VIVFALLLILVFKPERKVLNVLSWIAFACFCLLEFFARSDVFSGFWSAAIWLLLFYVLGRLIIFVRKQLGKAVSFE
jgi:hypothetical protein